MYGNSETPQYSTTNTIGTLINLKIVCHVKIKDKQKISDGSDTRR
jgi:hypothetical protein